MYLPTLIHRLSSSHLLLGAVSCGVHEAAIETLPPEVSSVASLVAPSLLESLTAATAVVSEHPGNAAAWAHLGSLYENGELFEQAGNAYLAGAERDPGNPHLVYRAAVAMGLGNDGERASKLLERTLELEPGYGPAWMRLGLSQLETGNWAGARVAFLQAAQKMGQAADPAIGLTRLALLEDDVAAALRHAQRALKRSPTDPYVQQLLGTALRRAGRAAEALPLLRAGQGALPSYRDPWHEQLRQSHASDDSRAAYARSLEIGMRWDEALAVYRKLLDERPDDIRLLIRVGVCLRGAGRLDLALANSRELLERFPGHYDLLVAHAGVLRHAGDWDGARTIIDQVLEDWPQRALAYLERGSIRRDQGDTSGALADFARATQLDPSDLRGRYFEGQLLAQLGKLPKAAAVLVGGLEMNAQPSLLYVRLLLEVQRTDGASPQALQQTMALVRAYYTPDQLAIH